jgi:hypothetical protein
MCSSACTSTLQGSFGPGVITPVFRVCLDLTVIRMTMNRDCGPAVSALAVFAKRHTQRHTLG